MWSRCTNRPRSKTNTCIRPGHVKKRGRNMFIILTRKKARKGLKKENRSREKKKWVQGKKKLVNS